MPRQSGYYRFPTLHDNHVVFVCEDDLWSVPAEGGVAVRLTSNLGEVSHPFLSPDGTRLGFIGREEGNSEVYCMPAEGGVAQRLTFLGARCQVAGWSPDGGSILFASNAGQPFRRIFNLHQIHAEGGMPEALPVGPAHAITYGLGGRAALGRNTGDLARWKRYRGGTAGVLWIDPEGNGEFRKLINLPGNLASPMWIGERIFFLSDHEGVGNLYSCTPAGEDLRQHTQGTEYYARNASTDGHKIVYHTGADLSYFDPATEVNRKIEVEFRSPQVQRQRKFVDACDFLESYDLHPEDHSIIVTARGKSFYFGNWEGAVVQLVQPDGVRYRLTRWLSDKKRFVTISDRNGIETIEVHNSSFGTEVEQLQGLNLGRAIHLEVSPLEDKVALTNHRHELILVDLSNRQSQVLDRSPYQRIRGLSWSPDGQWLAYSHAETQATLSIKVCHLPEGRTYRLTPPRFKDVQPAFDPDGKFIYFLSVREFNPVYDAAYFDLGFPRGMRPFLISLQKQTPSPFVSVPKPLKANANQKATKGNTEPEETGENPELKNAKNNVSAVEIDFEGIEQRIVGFPVPEGRYGQIWGLKGKVLFTSFPIRGSLDHPDQDTSEEEEGATLEFYDFEEQKRETIATEVTSFRVSRENETLLYRSKKRLRVCAIAPQDKNKPNDKQPGRKTGWLDLKRLRLSVVPPYEWQQMFREIWRLQKEHFWREDMSNVDWERVYQRYLPLLDRVASRSEFSDLIWEMQGELGTSHAYEYGGDYRKEPNYRLGFLGADFVYDAEADAYQIAQIVQGDSWNEKVDSPLNRIGVNAQVGDLLLAVNGQRVSRTCAPQALLVHQSACEVTLTFASSDSPEGRTVTVKTLANETQARYRQWVEQNHQIVEAATGGRVGYVHVPDMGPQGYAEFHRYYFAEVQKDALIVDVRYNGGGHVSQLVLEKLARKRLGYDVSRWGQPEPYPADSPLGPVVALTNEQAGSDGDIFSHCFKLMQLGTLIGKRTWGGVIGIWPRHALVDGSVVTQPEFSFWFTDVGWGVENYGTDPDIEVEITPQQWARGEDPQLDRAIQLILDQLQKQPVQLPDFGDHPRLTLPG